MGLTLPPAVLAKVLAAEVRGPRAVDAYKTSPVSPESTPPAPPPAGAVHHRDDRPPAWRLVVPVPGLAVVSEAVESGPGRFVLVMPVKLESEANAGGSLRAAIGRKAAVKRAVFRSLAPHWQAWGPIGDHVRAGRPLDVVITRIGGRGLDTANAYRAVKPVEDCLATVLGCDDGSPFWRLRAACEPGPAWGVRIELTGG